MSERWGALIDRLVFPLMAVGFVLLVLVAALLATLVVREVLR